MSFFSYSVEEWEVVPVVSHVEELGVVETGTSVHAIDLGNLVVRKLDLSSAHVLAETLSLRGLDKRDGLALQVPGKDDLSW